MKAVRWVALGLVAVAWSAPSWAQDSEAEAKEKQKRRDQQFQESLGWYRVTSARAPEVPLKIQPVLRWTNPTRGQEGEPTLVFWTDAGRPEALSSVYIWSGNLIYECVSLSRGAGLVAREGGRTAWSPEGPGVSFREVPDAPAPAATPAARLQQMKAIAGRFGVTMISNGTDLSDREEMRLLPRPIYRYDLAGSAAAHPDLVDGAAFAFVQGTDPEAILLVEAVRRDGKTSWQYAFARATTAGLVVKLGPSIVWTASVTAPWNDPRQPTLSMGRRLVD